MVSFPHDLRLCLCIILSFAGVYLYLHLYLFLTISSIINYLIIINLHLSALFYAIPYQNFSLSASEEGDHNQILIKRKKSRFYQIMTAKNISKMILIEIIWNHLALNWSHWQQYNDNINLHITIKLNIPRN